MRPARPDEAAALHTLVRAAYARWVSLIGREPRPMNDDYAARIAAGQAWVLEDPQGALPGALLGALVLEDEPDALMIDNVALAPAAQGRGLGRHLMEFAEAEGRRRGHPRLRLFTNVAMESNIRLYARLGFIETHRVVEGPVRAVFMEKRLA
jgi:ribosomal protein S18 acetylase RimI-like enzyme